MPSSLQLYCFDPNNPAAAAACHRRSHFVPPADPESLNRLHRHTVAGNQCSSVVIQTIDAPVDVVWSLLRRFDSPQSYKQFLKSCRIVEGDGASVGTLREVQVVSGLPAGSSRERLEILDEEKHVVSFSVVGGEHRLRNYRSVTSVHSSPGGGGGAVVVESYVVDIPPGNTREETCVFVNTIVRCNLQSLAQISQKIAKSTKQTL